MSDVLNDSCVAEVRAKYAEDLEELLLCPVCLVRPTVHVRICKLGHHLCQTCWSSLRECPTCKTPFSPDDGRSFLAEELSSRWDEFSSVFAPPPILLPERTIDCRIGLCQTRLPTERMPEHVRNVHASSLMKMEQIGGAWLAEWKAEYDVNKCYSYSLEAPGLGWFFIIFFTNENGDAEMELQVAHSCPGSDRLRYTMGVRCPRTVSNGCYGKCALGDEKGKHVLRVGRNQFSDYFKGGIRDEENKEPSILSVAIEKIN